METSELPANAPLGIFNQIVTRYFRAFYAWLSCIAEIGVPQLAPKKPSKQPQTPVA
jgi:hypothetical protein